MKMIPEKLWEEIKNEIPNKKTRVGRPEMCPRKALEGIFFILRTGSQWRYMPMEFGKTSTIHGKFRKWILLGVFEKIMSKAVNFYRQNTEDLCWYAIDTSSSKAPFASWSGKNPTDRKKRGIKKTLITDWYGAPLALNIGAANTHDSQFFAGTFAKLTTNTRKPNIIAADSAFDSKKLRTFSQKNSFILLAATNRRRLKNKRVYKPTGRWIIERTFGWLNWNRGLKTCWTKTEDSFKAFYSLACAIQLFRMKGIFV